MGPRSSAFFCFRSPTMLPVARESSSRGCCSASLVFKFPLRSSSGNLPPPACPPIQEAKRVNIRLVQQRSPHSGPGLGGIPGRSEAGQLDELGVIVRITTPDNGAAKAADLRRQVGTTSDLGTPCKWKDNPSVYPRAWQCFCGGTAARDSEFRPRRG
jgi:hypothetical protein